MKYFITLMIGLVLMSEAAHAVEKRYVSDQLFIQLRSGASNAHRILKAVSYTHLTLPTIYSV